MALNHGKKTTLSKFPDKRGPFGSSCKKWGAEMAETEADLELEVVCLEEQRIILMTGEINEVKSHQFLRSLLTLSAQDPVKEITLYLSTYGGDTYEMLGMHDMMKMVKCPIHTIAVGKVMSAGVLLLAAGTRRSAAPNTIIMLHQVSTGMSGNVQDLSIEVSHVQALQGAMYKLYSQYTGTPIKTIEHDLSHDRYFTTEEALKYGLIDEIIVLPLPKAKKARRR